MKAYCLVLLFVLASLAWGQSPVPSDSIAAHQFVWTDSLIANRGPFATPPPPESFKPDTIDGKLYWHGGVFVLPGTPDSILLANGFVNVKKEPGSVMHDYFEAIWPIEMELEELPLSIRQLKYSARPMGYPFSVDWKQRENPMQEGTFYQVILFTIPGLPEGFFNAFGIKGYVLSSLGWCTKYSAYWPEVLAMKNAPPEFYYLDVPPLAVEE